MKTILLLALLAQDKTDLVVHEWGTFTTVAGSDGATLEWRPLAGPSDLPEFVYEFGGARGLRHGPPCKVCRHFACGCGDRCQAECRGCKSCYSAEVRMETPVLYFYSDRETTVRVKVDFPKGRVTEWYPQAREVGTGIDWGGVRVMGRATAKFPVADGHYREARATDASPVRVCGADGEQFEKFLFYRGVGSFDLPLKVVDGEVKSAEPVTGVIHFENRRGRISFRSDRRRGETIAALEDELVRILTAEGLYDKEARAMVATWRDSWFEEGVRVFYVVPRKTTDAILPLTIEPAPKELVRVLVGRYEILTPEMEKRMAALVEKLGDPSVEVREQAAADLKKYGRFAEPLLKRVTSTDPEVRARIREILGSP